MQQLPKEPKKPEKPGIFTRFFSSIKEAFGGGPLESVQKYRDDMVEYDKQSRFYSEVKESLDNRAERQRKKNAEEPVKEQPKKEEPVKEQPVKTGPEKAPETKSAEKDPMTEHLKADCEILKNPGSDQAQRIGALADLATSKLIDSGIKKESEREITNNALKETRSVQDLAKDDEAIKDLMQSCNPEKKGNCMEVMDKVSEKLNNLQKQKDVEPQGRRLQKTIEKTNIAPAIPASILTLFLVCCSL